MRLCRDGQPKHLLLPYVCKTREHIAGNELRVALFIHRSNRLDTHLATLGDIVAVPLSSHFASETIVVSSLGLERWLSAELSRRFGVWTNGEHPLPRTFVERVLRTLAPSNCPFDAWDNQHLPLSIAQILSEQACVKQWPSLDGYIEGPNRRERCFELGRRIADVFDQYFVYRPDWIDAWQQGKPCEARVESWQPGLFVELLARLGPNHFARRIQQALERLSEDALSLDELPERISCFQVGLMPPSYLRLLQALSRRIETHLFVLSPSRAYVDLTRNHRSQGRVGGDAAAATRERWEQQPLFASLCRQSRQLDEVLAEFEGATPGREQYFEAEPHNLLELLQSDICELRSRRLGAESIPYSLTADDRSIQVHACHSRRREIECLREVLLDQFEADPSLAPEDVLVMVADVRAYAPLVDAVFGLRQVGQIPYTIADRSPLSYNDLADSLLRVLDLFSQRLTIERLLELLSLERIRLKFKIAADQLGTIEQWLQRLQFTWGFDAVERQSFGAPSADEHTLSFGLSRLLLGAALDSRTAPVCAGRAPFDVEGDDAELAGLLAEACESIIKARTQLLQEQEIESYATLVAQLVDELLDVEQDRLWQRTEIRDRLGDWSRTAREAGFSGQVAFHTLRQELTTRLEATTSARSFLGGGVTFCKMLPLRSIPFRVIAMVGLHDGQFPRRGIRASFDALNQDTRSGDRNVADEDRFLFVETLLACRERLIVTYVGRSARDDSVLPPSVVVEELLDAIDQSCASDAVGSPRPRDRVHLTEALQPYSPRYFDGSHPLLVNRSHAHFRAASALRSTRSKPRDPSYGALELPEFEALELRDLVGLLRNPGRLYLERTLHVASDPHKDLLDGNEPIVLDPFSEWRLTRELLDARRRGEPEHVTVDHLRAAGELPILAMGDWAVALIRRRVASLLSAAEPYCQGAPLEPQWVSLAIDGIRIEGWIDSVWSGAHIHMRRSRVAAAGLVEAWLEHLFLCTAGYAIATVMIARSKDGRSLKCHEFAPLEPAAAKGHLGQLLQDYRLALTVPLPFFLDPADAYIRALATESDHRTALERAAEMLAQMVAEGKLASQFDALYGDDPCADDWPVRCGVQHVLNFSEWSKRWLVPLYRALAADADAEAPESNEAVE
jgi:exodeoxyribonuclease V gamma subunit